MKIISWNVAGFRACHKKGLEESLIRKMQIFIAFRKQK